MRYESPQGSNPSGLGQIYREEDVAFYQLSLLTNDLALSECLYAEVHCGSRLEVCPPNTISRLEIAKTPAKVLDDFVVPNGFVDRDHEDSPSNRAAEEASDAESQQSLAVLADDPYTISFEWSDKEIHDTRDDAYPTRPFHECLEILQSEIEEKVASGVQTIETLYVKYLIHTGLPYSFNLYRLRAISTSVSVLDVDKASGDFVDFLDDIKRLITEPENENDEDEGRQLMVSNILSPRLQAAVGLRDTTELSSIHESLVQTWIVPLSRQIPGRVRIALEKLLRNMSGQICFASYAMRINLRTGGKEDNDQSENVEAGARFELPVRRRASVTSLGKGKGKERADAMTSPPPVSSQMSEDAGFMPSPTFTALPTPEPTPSLRSRSSVSSLAGSEDPASLRLRAYANLTPRPALPANLSNLRGQWQLGGDPATYNWEAAQQATVIGSDDELQGRQRRRAKKQQKRQRDSTVGPSSQPEPKRLGGSQPQQGQDTQDTQGSSQQTERAVTMSQVEPGKFGGRHIKSKKPKVKIRPAGFK